MIDANPCDGPDLRKQSVRARRAVTPLVQFWKELNGVSINGPAAPREGLGEDVSGVAVHPAKSLRSCRKDAFLLPWRVRRRRAHQLPAGAPALRRRVLCGRQREGCKFPVARRHQAACWLRRFPWVSVGPRCGTRFLDNDSAP